MHAATVRLIIGATTGREDRRAELSNRKRMRLQARACQRVRTTLQLVCALLVIASPAWAVETPTPLRIWDGWTKRWATLDEMLDSLSREHVVLVGEQHDSPATHRFERTLFDGLIARRKRVTLALEMFERDVQTVVDRYLEGTIDEATFAREARAWPNHDPDYRPLLERARAGGLPVVASNVPRSLASRVSREGLTALDGLPANHRWLYARHTSTPDDAYRARFVESMQAHAGASNIDRYYAAQCLKDDTMAESVADWIERRGDDAGLVMHISGAFHIDGHLGLYPRLRERMTDKANMATVRIVPVPRVSDADPKAWNGVADWVVFVTAP